MKFKYIGDGNYPPEKCNFVGKIKFVLNGPFVEVPEDLMTAVRGGKPVYQKLLGNQCFIEKEAYDKQKADAKKAKEKEAAKGK